MCPHHGFSYGCLCAPLRILLRLRPCFSNSCLLLFSGHFPRSLGPKAYQDRPGNKISIFSRIRNSSGSHFVNTSRTVFLSLCISVTRVRGHPNSNLHETDFRMGSRESVFRGLKKRVGLAQALPESSNRA